MNNSVIGDRAAPTGPPRSDVSMVDSEDDNQRTRRRLRPAARIVALVLPAQLTICGRPGSYNDPHLAGFHRLAADPGHPLVAGRVVWFWNFNDLWYDERFVNAVRADRVRRRRLRRGELALALGLALLFLGGMAVEEARRAASSSCR